MEGMSMNTTQKLGLKVGTIALALLVSSSAFAQGTKASDSKDGYGYEFKDDPLAAGGLALPTQPSVFVQDRFVQRSSVLGWNYSRDVEVRRKHSI